MASLNFPSNPTEGQEYTANGTTWKFTNDKWIISVPEPVVSINDLSDASSNTSLNSLVVGFGSSYGSSSNSIIFGVNSGSTESTFAGNVILGHEIELANSSVGYSVAIGDRAMATGTGISIGPSTQQNTEGLQSVAIGAYSLGNPNNHTTGDENIAIGVEAGYDITSGDNNVLVGRFSGGNITAGADNTLIGSYSGFAMTTGNNNIVIGRSASPSTNTVSNEITLGNNSTSRFRIPGLSLDTDDATNGQLLGWNGSDFTWVENTAVTGGFATETYVDTAIADLANSAPATLDTLNELAAALGDDANFATTVTNSLGDKANTADLATVATSGSYSDLSGTPTLATVATSGSYSDLSGTPSIPVSTTVTSNGTFLAIEDAAFETYYGGTAFAGNPDRQYIAINSQFAYSNTYPFGSEVYGPPNEFAPQFFISSIQGNEVPGDTARQRTGSIIIGGGNAIDATPGDQPGLRATIIGIEAMASSTYPQYTTAVGYRALNKINQSPWNTVVGMYAAEGLTNGANNTIVGHMAGRELDEGWNNIIVGANAQSSSNTSNNEITLGNVEITKIRVPGISGWEVREATDSLIFTVGGNDVMQLFANGDMTITGSINTNGTI